MVSLFAGSTSRPAGAGAVIGRCCRPRTASISAPFAGIEASTHYGSKTLAALSLGLVKRLCHMITGAKYRDINPVSPFITDPGILQRFDLLPDIPGGSDGITGPGAC